MQGLKRALANTRLRLAAVVWVFGYVLVDIAAMADGRSSLGQMFLANLPLLGLGVAQSVGLAILLDRTSARPSLIRWPLLVVAGLAAGLVQTAADDVWLRTVALTLVPEWRGWAVPFQPDRLFIVALLYIWTMYLTIALAWAAWSSDQSRLNEARAAVFEAAASRAEAAALRLQLNPHFLFNTLNGIASLVVRGRQVEAEEMIGRLADFLRSSLAADPTAMAPLSREVETVSAYLAIEQARLDDRLAIEIDVPDALAGAPVPNFILQPLVENAVKHGASRTRRPTTIVIQARTAEDDLILTVRNHDGTTDRPIRGVRGGRPGIGLANTRKRLETQYGQMARLTAEPAPGGFAAEIRLPRSAA